MARNPAIPLTSVCEVAKTRWRAVPYTGGKGLDLGCGSQRLYDTEFVVSLDNGAGMAYGMNCVANIQMDCKELTALAGGSWDYVFSSFLLQDFDYKDVPAVLRDWMRVIRHNGHLVLYLPDERLVPKVQEPERGIKGEDGAHPAQRWNVNYGRITEAMGKTHWNWDLVHYEECSDADEYGLFFAFKRLK